MTGRLPCRNQVMRKYKLVLEHKEDKIIQPLKGYIIHSFALSFNKILWNYKVKTHGEYKDGFSNDLSKESLILMTIGICLSSRRSSKCGSHPKSKNVI